MSLTAEFLKLLESLGPTASVLILGLYLIRKSSGQEVAGESAVDKEIVLRLTELASRLNETALRLTDVSLNTRITAEVLKELRDHQEKCFGEMRLRLDRLVERPCPRCEDG